MLYLAGTKKIGRGMEERGRSAGFSPCGNNNESICHLLAKCPFAKSIWFLFWTHNLKFLAGRRTFEIFWSTWRLKKTKRELRKGWDQNGTHGFFMARLVQSVRHFHKALNSCVLWENLYSGKAKESREKLLGILSPPSTADPEAINPLVLAEAYNWS